MSARIQAIRERVEKATKGEWRVEFRDDDHGEKNHIVHSDCGDVCGLFEFARPDEYLKTQRHDAEFIANAPSDQRFLLTALDAVSAMIPHDGSCHSMCGGPVFEDCHQEKFKRMGYETKTCDKDGTCTCYRQQRIDAAIEAAAEMSARAQAGEGGEDE